MQINVKETFCYAKVRQGERARCELRLINKNENAACLDSCSAIPMAARPRSRRTQLGPRTRTRPGRAQGRQPERDSDNVYMLITCENMQQTVDSQRQPAICHEVYFFTPTEITGVRERLRRREPKPNLKPTPAPARHGLLLCVPFKVNLPVRPSVRRLCRVCGHTNYNSNNNNGSSPDVPYASVDEAL